MSMFGHSTMSPPGGKRAEPAVPPPPAPTALPSSAPPGPLPVERHGDAAIGPSVPASPRLPVSASALPPAPPRPDMLASGEMQAWLRRLQREDEKIGRRNQYLVVALAAGVVLLVLVLSTIYRATIGSRAVIDEIAVEQDPVNPGRLQISYRVVSPGRVHCRRTSGDTTTDVVDQYRTTCEVERPWTWSFQPGQPIEVTLWYRGGLFPRSFRQQFPTVDRADIVVLIDTTGSMDASLAALKESCVAFSARLADRSLEHRLALLGFGDTNEGVWLDAHEFTRDATEFQRWAAELRRFDGGDLPESALDAIAEALRLPLDDGALHYFYLVTDASFHAPTQNGESVETIARRLREQRVMLRVFSRAEFSRQYAPLLGTAGRFDEIEEFGKVLSEGRILED